MTTRASWSERELAGLLAEGRLDFALAGTCGSAAAPDATQQITSPAGRTPGAKRVTRSSGLCLRSGRLSERRSPGSTPG